MRGLRVASIIFATVVGLVVVAACGQSGSSAGTSGLASKAIAAGAVEVTIEPLNLDASGARFRVALDTHSGDLNVDLASSARLEVDGTDWGNASWTGDPPGGHHRQGELRFFAAGPVRGDVRLTISGLPGPVSATWNTASG